MKPFALSLSKGTYRQMRRLRPGALRQAQGERELGCEDFPFRLREGLGEGVFLTAIRDSPPPAPPVNGRGVMVSQLSDIA